MGPWDDHQVPDSLSLWLHYFAATLGSPLGVYIPCDLTMNGLHFVFVHVHTLWFWEMLKDSSEGLTMS